MTDIPGIVEIIRKRRAPGPNLSLGGIIQHVYCYPREEKRRPTYRLEQGDEENEEKSGIK